MQKLNVKDLVEFDDKRFLPKPLVNQPGFRLVLLNLRAGQSVPEHSTSDRVAVYGVAGHITFYENDTPAEIGAGEMVVIESGARHRLDAHEDSSVLVIRSAPAAATSTEELDLRQVPRPQRHPMVFAKFDALAVGESFFIVNDHDPIPLNLQMDNMRPGQLAWEYVDRGPDIFRIRIRRVAPLTGSETSPGVPSATVTRIGQAGS